MFSSNNKCVEKWKKTMQKYMKYSLLSGIPYSLKNRYFLPSGIPFSPKNEYSLLSRIPYSPKNELFLLSGIPYSPKNRYFLLSGIPFSYKNKYSLFQRTPISPRSEQTNLSLFQPTREIQPRVTNGHYRPNILLSTVWEKPRPCGRTVTVGGSVQFRFGTLLILVLLITFLD